MTPLYRFCRFLVWVFFKVVFRLKVEGLENLTPLRNKKLLLAGNHASFFDPPLVGVACPWGIHYLARKTLMDNPIMGYLLPRLNVTPVDSERAEISALRQVVRLLENEKTTLIFPEGTRTYDGHFLPARPGIGLIVAKTLAPVVPVRIFGSYEAYPRGRKLFRFVPLRVKFGPPIYFTKETLAERSRQCADPRGIYQMISDEIMAAIAKID